MNRAAKAIGNAEAALAHARRAASLWNASDPDRVEQTRLELESVILAAGELETLLQREPAAGTASVGISMIALKAEACRIERLVDASSAFLRAAFPSIGEGSPVYGSAGTLRLDSAPISACGLEC